MQQQGLMHPYSARPDSEDVIRYDPGSLICIHHLENVYKGRMTFMFDSPDQHKREEEEKG